eukprot:15011210-Alexandrium_andersonii.AAC.1
MALMSGVGTGMHASTAVGLARVISSEHSVDSTLEDFASCGGNHMRNAERDLARRLKAHCGHIAEFYT